MAAAIIPIATAFEPLAVELVVKLVDKLLGSKTGAIKKPTAVAVLQALGQGMVTVGQMASGQAPDTTAGAAIVQTAVDKLNAKGELQGAATVLTSGPALATSDARMILTVLAAVAPALGAK